MRRHVANRAVFIAHHADQFQRGLADLVEERGRVLSHEVVRGQARTLRAKDVHRVELFPILHGSYDRQYEVQKRLDWPALSIQKALLDVVRCLLRQSGKYAVPTK